MVDMDIKKIRKSLSLTQEAFAEEVGVAFSTVNRWEGGRRKPSKLALRRIEELLGRKKRNKEAQDAGL